eukprot:TRINITY_DN828_c0_g1_i1.p1 TRINITY_DN828_c0_g1~~TRINITY_DN828_c0_g1_i1.p1  ORF type:complete len:122 (+),score=12.08 TRINITY_DN828_c0_g1_i1:88-453(+)
MVMTSWVYKLVKEDVECRSRDVNIGEGKRVTLHACADACADTPGCRFFIHSKAGQTGSKVGNCFWEQTSSEYCSEGFNLIACRHSLYELHHFDGELPHRTPPAGLVIACIIVGCFIALNRL